MKRQIVRCAVLTISDRASRGEYADESGPAIADILTGWGWQPEATEILPDEEELIAQRMGRLADQGFDLILTTGGTGLGPRDRTPEATLRVADRIVPGLGEMIRARTATHSPRAYLSRSLAALCRKCLIINLPGSVRGARESLEALRELLPHAIDVIREDRLTHDSHGRPGDA
ncbi:MAG: MogA/MoaB family molybdenum cofactor biosynthesis protein [Candidatus Eisenbacteria bacterium]|nr:MogA/MoaB family molybdenum cofactor biosynthesis protein [Candidatus Eisenbacteria bacterium]